MAMQHIEPLGTLFNINFYENEPPTLYGVFFTDRTNVQHTFTMSDDVFSDFNTATTNMENYPEFRTGIKAGSSVLILDESNGVSVKMWLPNYKNANDEWALGDDINGKWIDA